MTASSSERPRNSFVPLTFHPAASRRLCLDCFIDASLPARPHRTGGVWPCSARRRQWALPCLLGEDLLRSRSRLRRFDESLASRVLGRRCAIRGTSFRSTAWPGSVACPTSRLSVVFARALPPRSVRFERTAVSSPRRETTPAACQCGPVPSRPTGSYIGSDIIAERRSGGPAFTALRGCAASADVLDGVDALPSLHQFRNHARAFSSRGDRRNLYEYCVRNRGSPIGLVVDGG